MQEGQRISITVPEVAEMLGIGINKAYELVRQEDFPCIRLGNRIVISRSEFLKWFEEQAVAHRTIAV